MTQAQLADVLGITPVHVNRVFQQLRREGAVLTERSMFKIVCAQRLLSIAEFDPQYLLIPELNAAEA